jgi:predicted alpha/beta superfamily hydrolase
MQQLDTPSVSNDKAILINSKVLNEQRSIWIHLPSDYYTTTRTYPVIYLLDGEGHFGYVSTLADYLSDYDRNRIPEMAVVAIHNVDRTRDFTPLHSLIFGGKIDSARMATTGGGVKFLQFIQTELVPFIDSNYRTQPYRILAAHSLVSIPRYKCHCSPR